MKSLKLNYYTRQGLWDLFLICAFPLFLWTLLMSFRDISWLTERTNAWDAVGVMAYGMIFAFAESIVIFIAVVLLGFLIPPRWSEKRIALLSMLVLILALWSIANQLFFIWGLTLPSALSHFLWSTAHPARYFALALSPIIFITFAVPTYFILQTERGFKICKDIFERLSLLSLIYLFFGVIGLVVVILRNI